MKWDWTGNLQHYNASQPGKLLDMEIWWILGVVEQRFYAASHIINVTLAKASSRLKV